MVPEIDAAANGSLTESGIRPASSNSCALEAKSRSLTRSSQPVVVKPTLISLNWTGPCSSVADA